MSVDVIIQGDKELIANLELLKEKVQKRFIKAAGRAALKPVVAEARKGVPRDTGNLRKSIGVKQAKKTPRGLIVLSVGPRKGHEFVDEDGKKQDPFYYGIPVEYGHDSYPPAGFLRNAYNKHRTTIYDNFAKELRKRIDGVGA